MVTCLIECLCQCTIAYIYIPGDHYSVQLGYPKTTATTDFRQKLPEKSVIRQVKSDLLQNLSRDRLNAICSRSCHATQVMPELLQKSSLVLRHDIPALLQKSSLPGRLRIAHYRSHCYQTGYIHLVCCKSQSPDRLHLVCLSPGKLAWFAAEVIVTRQVTPGLLQMPQLPALLQKSLLQCSLLNLIQQVPGRSKTTIAVRCYWAVNSDLKNLKQD